MPKYTKNYAAYILKDYEEKIKIFLPGSTTKSVNYDKFRDVGYTSSNQNWLTVKAWIRETSASELVFRQLGVIATGAKKVIIKNNDINLFKIAHKILIDEVDFYVFNDAVGSKMQIQKLDANYSEITLFKKDI